MAKLNKDFFTDNEVLLVGYTSKANSLSKAIYPAFVNNGIKVYPLNTKANGSYDIKVYDSLKSLPKVPECAVVLLNKENVRKAINELGNSGVKRILFQNKKMVDSDILEECRKIGIEAVIACPMMILGSGLHKFHGFLAGVR